MEFIELLGILGVGCWKKRGRVVWLKGIVYVEVWNFERQVYREVASG